MIRHDRTARPGVTLLEVLTAIFIMGVGLLAILTLFPLGALSMARAIRDDRAAAAGGNANALATAMDLRNDPVVVSVLTAAPPPGPVAFAPADPDGPSYAVLVDPLYTRLGSFSVGAVAGATPGIRRCSPQYVSGLPALAQPQATARWFSFPDEIAFEKTGEPTGGAAVVNRPGTYSWTYLVRRPRSSVADMTEVSVLVYANRPTDAPSGEILCYTGAVMGTAGTNSVALTFAGDKPNFRKGGWILDTSYVTSVRNGVTYGTVNGYCYQVASATDTGANSMTLELETPLKSNVTALVLLENVITVLDRGTNWKP